MNFPKAWYVKYNTNKDIQDKLELILESYGYKIDKYVNFHPGLFYILRVSTGNPKVLCFSENQSIIKGILNKRNFVELKITDILKL